MANFPTSPSVGTTTVINGMTYAYNSQGAWEIALTQSDESLVDVGVSTFESQVQFNDTSGTQVLYHFNDNLTDNGPNSITATSANLTYGTGKFGKAAQFNGATDGTNTHIDFTGGGNDIGTGPYTIEFWANVTEFDYGTVSNNVNGRAEFINSHSDQSTQAGPGYYKITTYGGSLYVNHHDGTAWTQIIGTHGMSVGTWYHIAVSRDSGGTTRVFIGTTGTNTLIATHTGPAISIGDGGYAWTLGRTMDNTTGHGSWGNYHLKGLIDELLITKTAKYTSTFTVPTAPHDDIVTKPPAVAGKALLYAKDVTGGSAAEVLYHFEDDAIDDSSGNGNNGTPTNINYATSTAGASSSGFGEAAVFDGSSQTSGGDSYFTFDRVDIGTGNYTISFWINLDSVADGQHNSILTSLSPSGWGADTFQIVFGSWATSTGKELRFYYYDGGTPHDEVTLTMNAGTWYHLAFVRDGTSHAWYQGTAGQAQGSRILNVTHTAHSMGATSTSGDDWVVGRLRTGSGYGIYNLTGKMDELLIAKEVLPAYSGFPATYAIPTVPYSALYNISKLHVMDSTGSEGVIS